MKKYFQWRIKRISREDSNTKWYVQTNLNLLTLTFPYKKSKKKNLKSEKNIFNEE